VHGSAPPAPPRLAALPLFSSPLFSFLCVCTIGAGQSNATKSKATKSKTKKSKAKERRLSVCMSVSYPQTTRTTWMRVACTFRPIRRSSPPLVLPLFSSHIRSYLCVCRIGAEQSNATKSKATKSKARKSNAKQRRLSVCLPASFPQTTTASGIQVACMVRPIRHVSPCLALPRFSSPLPSYFCV
jgi:hypothetical protein